MKTISDVMKIWRCYINHEAVGGIDNRVQSLVGGSERRLNSVAVTVVEL